MMRIPPRVRPLVIFLVLALFAGLLLLFFPVAFTVMKMAAHSVMALWWAVLLLALAGWLIWSGFRKP